MPVIVIGADTPIGSAVARALAPRAGETRAFVSDPFAADEFRSLGVKVAIGDVSDGSHVGGAAIGCFVAVVVTEAAFDGRERAFADTAADLVAAWRSCLSDSGTHRVIWVDAPEHPISIDDFGAGFPEFARVAATGRAIADIAAEVAHLDDLATLEDA